ncbi:MAG: hypothetical protein RIC51_04495 [Erythrobacter sp.]
MRTALLASLDHDDDGSLRAGLLFGGRSVLAWQGETMRALGCERVICLTERFGEEILSLQRAVEGGGGEFHALRSGRQLPALVRADDELIVLLDGLVVDRAVLQAAISSEGVLAKGVATLPAGHPLAQAHPEVFERIDRERAWAGALVMHAAPVQQFADLPADGATVPLLLRLALQSGTPCRALAPEAISAGEWLLAGSDEALAARERVLIDSGLVDTPWTGPGLALAQQIARRLAPRGLSAGPFVGAGMALILLVTGTVLAGFGFGPAGLVLAAMGAFAGVWSLAAARIARGHLGETARAFPAARFSGICDILASAALGLAALFSNGDATGPAIGALGPLTVGLTRLAARAAGPLARAFWKDRPIHLAGLAFAAGFDLLAPALALFGLAALVQSLLHSGSEQANADLTIPR